MTPLCGTVSLAWAAAGLLTLLIKMRTSIKKAQEFTAQVHTSKGQCVSARVRVCLNERQTEERSAPMRRCALVLHVSSHFQLPRQLKDAAERFPNKEHTLQDPTGCQIPTLLTVMYGES